MAGGRILTGLIGRGIGKSRSPAMHEAEAAAQGLELTYTLFDLAEPQYADIGLPQLLAKLEDEGRAGVNVTHPFKQAVIPHLDRLADEAARIGAVNTVRFSGGERIGYNTDVTGFEAAFRQTLRDAPADEVVQVGAGGAGSATADALVRLGVRKLTLFDSDAGRTRDLAARLAPYAERCRIDTGTDLTASLAGADGLINATPVGMADYPGMAVPATALRASLWVAELVYFPLETALLAAARRLGCRTMDGSGMAVYQAARAFEIFTGTAPDAERMRHAFVTAEP